jgi:hypothetical protein
MSFEASVVALAERFLSTRTFELIVAPAVADLQFERSAGALRQAANRLAVLKAVAGGLRTDAARASRSLLTLTLVPACYYIFLLVLCFDLFSISIATDFIIFASLILVLSFAPVIVCVWPERPSARPVE